MKLSSLMAVAGIGSLKKSVILQLILLGTGFQACILCTAEA